MLSQRDLCLYMDKSMFQPIVYFGKAGDFLFRMAIRHIFEKTPSCVFPNSYHPLSNIMHASFCRWENCITLFSTKYRYKKAAATLTAPFIVIEHIMYGVTVRWKLPSWSSEADFQSVWSSAPIFKNSNTTRNNRSRKLVALFIHQIFIFFIKRAVVYDYQSISFMLFFVGLFYNFSFWITSQWASNDSHDLFFNLDDLFFWKWKFF